MNAHHSFRLRLVGWVWLALRMAIALFPLTAAPAQANAIAVQSASLEADAAGWMLNARFEFQLNSSLEEAVNKGIPLYFTTEFKLTRPRWYWFDQQATNTVQRIRLSYQPLRREYRVSSGGLQLRFAALDEALDLIKHVISWHVIDRNAVHIGDHYIASVRMRLDTALMPKPFQIDAVNNHDWNLSSDWKRFPFIPRKDGK